MLLIVSNTAVIKPADKTPQSPLWPKIVDKLIAKKNPNKIAIKFIKTTLIMYWNLSIVS
jgi:hypothetical protein